MTYADLTPVPFAEPRGIARRACTTCGESKGLAEFTRDRRRPTGYGSCCLECDRARVADYARANADRKRDYRAANADQIAERNADYRATNRARPLDLADGHLPKRCAPPTSQGCGEMLIRGDFNRKRSTADQRHPLCRPCKARKNANSGYRKICREAHGDPVGQTCHLSGRTIGPDDAVEVDHLVPQSKGGTNDAWNLRWTLASANRSKYNSPTTIPQLHRLIPEILSPAGWDAVIARADAAHEPK